METDQRAGAAAPAKVLDPRRWWADTWVRMIVAAALGAVVALFAAWLLQRNFVLQDDTDRGARYADMLRDQVELGRDEQRLPTLCEQAAEAFYGHAMFEYEKGYAPRNEKAFFNACSGWAVGQFGGRGD